MQLASGWAISGRICPIDRGDPGRLTTTLSPRMPAICRDRTAVGTYRRDMARIASPMPGSSFSMTRRVASGVTSRLAGPVPPVVMTRPQPSSSIRARMASAIAPSSSATVLRVARHSDCTREPRTLQTSGPPRSVYSPRLARSLTVTTPQCRAVLPAIGDPPASGASVSTTLPAASPGLQHMHPVYLAAGAPPLGAALVSTSAKRDTEATAEGCGVTTAGGSM
mmetsp:Transcript_18803/g.48964  ORF Transcript_18803/g.48964 Transcript_18803/m.48964 type:complete len:223 (-) Transcript_18803:471-1139(-)